MTHDEPRHGPRWMLACTALAALAGEALACRPDTAPPPAASAGPVASAPSSAPPVASSATRDAVPAIVHEPGTVPSRPVARPAASGTKPDAAAAPPPVLTRLPAAKSRKSSTGGYSSASFPGKDALVAIPRDGGLDVVDGNTGAGYSISGAGSSTYALSSDGALVALADNDGHVTLWDTAKGALRATWAASASNVVFSPDDKRLAIAADTFVSVRDVATGNEVVHVTPEMPAFGVAFGAGGKELVLTENNVLVEAYAMDSGAKLPGGGSAQTGATFGVTLSPDGRWVAAAAPDGHGMQVFEVHAWGPRQLVEVTSCREHIWPQFSPNGRFVFAHGGTRFVKGFEVGSFKPYASYHAPEGATS